MLCQLSAHQLNLKRLIYRRIQSIHSDDVNFAKIFVIGLRSVGTWDNGVGKAVFRRLF